jgi:hypothetical protein
VRTVFTSSTIASGAYVSSRREMRDATDMVGAARSTATSTRLHAMKQRTNVIARRHRFRASFL